MAFQQRWIRSVLAELQNRVAEWNCRRIDEDMASRVERERIRAALLSVPGSPPGLTRRPGPFGMVALGPEQVSD